MHKCKSAINSTFCILLVLIVLLTTFCDDDPKTVTKCDLTAALIFINTDTIPLSVDLADSTKWYTISLQSKQVSLPESTIQIPAEKLYVDSINIVWTFEHRNNFETGEACSSEVYLEILAIISDPVTDSILSEDYLDLCCGKSSLDTSFIDSTGLQTEQFFCTDTIFFPQY